MAERFGTAAKLFSIFSVLVALTSLRVTYTNYKTQKRVADRSYEAQKQIADRIWRSQLITVIYETKDCPEGVKGKSFGKDEVCNDAPKASERSRAEAVQAYIALQAEYNLKINLSHTILSKMTFMDDEHTDFTGADFSHSAMAAATFVGKGRGADLSNANFYEAYLAWAKMSGANLSNAKMVHAILHGADLTGADLSGADLSKAEFGDCKNFDAGTQENHGSAKLGRAILGNVILSNANLCGVDLSGLDLRLVKNLSLEQLEKTYGSKATTKLPDYIPSMPEHWEN